MSVWIDLLIIESPVIIGAAVGLMALRQFHPISYLWRPKDDRARIARIALDLVEGDGWISFPYIHETELGISSFTGEVTLPGEKKARLGGYYQRLILKAVKRRQAQILADDLSASQVKFGENVISFARRRAK